LFSGQRGVSSQPLVNPHGIINEAEGEDWRAFKAVTAGILGNFKQENYVSHIEKGLSTYKFMGGKMAVTTHFLNPYLNFPP
jgi:hypothetical protein